jgi:hypothetical protein
MDKITQQFQNSLKTASSQVTSSDARKQIKDLLTKIETKEATGAGGGSGSYEGPLSGPKMSMWADEAPKKIQAKGGLVEEGTELDEKWSEKYKKSINCNDPKGFSQKAHCQGRKKDMKEEVKKVIQVKLVLNGINNYLKNIYSCRGIARIHYFDKLTKYMLSNLNILYLDYKLIDKIWKLDNLAKIIIICSMVTFHIIIFYWIFF